MPSAAEPAVCAADEHLITEAKARALAARGLPIQIGSGTLITPAAQDVLRHAGAVIIRV